MIEAMCVPCPAVSRPASSGLSVSIEKSGPLRTFPGVSSPGTGTTPVSIRATPTPLPVAPSLQSSFAPMERRISGSVPVATGVVDWVESSDAVRRLSGVIEKTDCSLRVRKASGARRAATPPMMSSRRVTWPPASSTAPKTALVSAPRTT